MSITTFNAAAGTQTTTSKGRTGAKAIRRNREVTMTDLAHHDRRMASDGRDSVEARLIFAACFVFFLVRAVLLRLSPFGTGTARMPIWREARHAARVVVASAFMGL